MSYKDRLQYKTLDKQSSPLSFTKQKTAELEITELLCWCQMQRQKFMPNLVFHLMHWWMIGHKGKKKYAILQLAKNNVIFQK